MLLPLMKEKDKKPKYPKWSFGEFALRFGIKVTVKPEEEETPPSNEDGDEGDEEMEAENEAESEDEEEGNEGEEEEDKGEWLAIGGFREVKTEGSRMFLFESVGQMVDAIDSKHYGTRHRDFGRDDLTTFAAFRKALVNPWTAGIETLDRCVRALEDAQLPELKQHVRRVRFGEEGDDFDYDRFRSGQSDFWRSSVREDASGPSEVTLFIDLTTGRYVEAENVLWRGAATIALAEVLESKGFRTEIWVVQGSLSFEAKKAENNVRMIDAVNLKQTHDPLDRSTLINAVSAWFYRLGMFAVRDTLEETVLKEARSANHYVAYPTPEDLDQISRDENRIYASGVFSFGGALSLVRAELEKLVH